jgi:hypothetical protein
MGQKNQYLDKHIPALYRKTALDIMIFTFIDAQRFTIPGISIENSALSFLKRYDIDEGDLSIEKIRKTYTRIQKELFEDQKTNNGNNTQ